MGIFGNPFKRQPRMQTFEPDRYRTPDEEHPIVNLQNVELLLPEQVVGQNVAAEEVAKLVQAAEESLRSTLTSVPDAFNLRLRFTIYPDKPVGVDLGVNIQHINQEMLQVAYDAINQLLQRELRAKHQAVALAAHFKVNKTEPWSD